MRVLTNMSTATSVTTITLIVLRSYDAIGCNFIRVDSKKDAGSGIFFVLIKLKPVPIGDVGISHLLQREYLLPRG